MQRHLIAAALGLALALSSFAAQPVRAEDGQITRAVAGLAAIALIGAAVSQAGKDKHDAYVKPEHHGRKTDENTLPIACLKDYPVAGADKRLVGRGCLIKHYRNVAGLPGSCEFRFRMKGHDHIGYDPGCLRNHGFAIG
ncbi:hypothetical protein [Chachezhania antarctica]|uniref:hypothetical protein n=1 Tax=Chachezhania antarctica TaxID=2340860 RepID=UPI000EB04519|nr:hypothetical protein [Chachezhania antarctica]|tara:strand:+ start:3683 stop:4099 length:417 start_codon:yes stop_codon:yes gene_type:complete